MNVRPCREPGCSGRIFFAETKTGARIPLDERPVRVYRVDRAMGKAEVVEEAVYRSHYETCTNPDRFNRSKGVNIREARIDRALRRAH